jgi:uncharacterized alkaline shock family protein YloU
MTEVAYNAPQYGYGGPQVPAGPPLPTPVPPVASDDPDAGGPQAGVGDPADHTTVTPMAPEYPSPVPATPAVSVVKSPPVAEDAPGSVPPAAPVFAAPSGRVAVQVVDRLGTTGKRGTTTIPNEVVEKIVTVSTREVPGVYAFSGATGTEDGERAILIDVSGQSATVSIRLVVEFGFAVHAVTEKVRTKVISALENLFALDVTAVDIAIDDIHIVET